MNASTDALSTGALVNSSQVPAELLDSIEVGIAVLDRNFNVKCQKSLCFLFLL